MRKYKLVASLLILIFSVSANAALTLTSPAFVNNGTIPNEFTYSLGTQCTGSNFSPPLVFSQVPAGTQSLALTVFDPIGGNWLHWKAWNIPTSTSALAANASATATFNQAANDFGTAGYGGACPPTPNHQYVFTLYALNASFSAEPTVAQLQAAAISTATLTGVRSPTDNLAWTPPAVTDCLFNWAEQIYPAELPVAGAVISTLVSAPYTYRHYPSANSYLAVSSQDSHLYYLGPITNNTIADLGLASTWYTQAGCQ